MTNGTEKTTCGTCRFWHAGPKNPMALDQRQGDCRFGPPGVTSLPAGIVGPQPLIHSAYPRLPVNMPACHQHQPQPVEIA